MVFIKNYKGCKIVYENGYFKAFKAGKVFVSERDSEQSVIITIDSFKLEEERKKEQVLAEKIKEKSLKQWNTGTFLEVDALEFKQFLKRILCFRAEATLFVDKNKLSCHCLDPANVALINPLVACNSNAKKFSFGINIKELCGVLSKTFWNRKAVLRIDFKIVEKVEKVVLSNGFGEISVSATSIEEKALEKKTLEKFSVESVLPCDVFNNIISIANDSLWNDNSIVFEAVKNKLFFKTKNDIGADYKSKGFKCKGEGICKYSVDYLKKPFFNKGNLKIQYAKNYLLKVTDDEGSFLILAPRVESD